MDRAIIAPEDICTRAWSTQVYQALRSWTRASTCRRTVRWIMRLYVWS